MLTASDDLDQLLVVIELARQDDRSLAGWVLMLGYAMGLWDTELMILRMDESIKVSDHLL